MQCWTFFKQGDEGFDSKRKNFLNVKVIIVSHAGTLLRWDKNITDDDDDDNDNDNDDNDDDDDN